MEKAIKKAIEGGFDAKNYPLNLDEKYMHDLNCIILLDPLFWQALGEVEGWNHQSSYCKHGNHKSCRSRVSCHCFCHKWHSFIDHLAEGKDANSFFEQLLTK